MMKRRRVEEKENHDRWVVSYADFITLMFAFFTILYATSEQNQEKIKKFEESIRKNLIRHGAMGETGDKVDQGTQFNTPIDTGVPTFPRGNSDMSKTQRKILHLLEENLSDAQVSSMVTEIEPDSLGIR